MLAQAIGSLDDKRLTNIENVKKGAGGIPAECRECVGPGIVHHNEVALLQLWQVHFLGDLISAEAQRSGNRDARFRPHMSSHSALAAIGMPVHTVTVSAVSLLCRSDEPLAVGLVVAGDTQREVGRAVACAHEEVGARLDHSNAEAIARLLDILNSTHSPGSFRVD